PRGRAARPIRAARAQRSDVGGLRPPRSGGLRPPTTPRAPPPRGGPRGAQPPAISCLLQPERDAADRELVAVLEALARAYRLAVHERAVRAAGIVDPPPAAPALEQRAPRRRGPVVEHDLGDAPAVHEGAVRALQVVQRVAAEPQADLGVLARNAAVVDHDVVLRIASDGERLGPERELAPLFAFADLDGRLGRARPPAHQRLPVEHRR